MAIAASFKLQKTHDNKFFFNLIAENGERILTSELYDSKASALKGLESITKSSQSDMQFRRKMSTGGEHFFVLAAVNGETISKSEQYSSREAMEIGIEAVKGSAANSKLIDSVEEAGLLPSKRPVSAERPLRVFLCHSSDDKPAVRKLYERLLSVRGIDPWLDEIKLSAGDNWEYEITRAVQETDIVIVCLSAAAINKQGYVQKEIRQALQVADLQPQGTVFIIPLKLEECGVPVHLRIWQWVDYYRSGAHDRLMEALVKRARYLGIWPQ